MFVEINLQLAIIVKGCSEHPCESQSVGRERERVHRFAVHLRARGNKADRFVQAASDDVFRVDRQDEPVASGVAIASPDDERLRGRTYQAPALVLVADEELRTRLHLQAGVAPRFYFPPRGQRGERRGCSSAVLRPINLLPRDPTIVLL